MAERYVRQLEFTNAVYLPNCPIALEKGAVLLDTKTDTYLLQLKFANIGETSIASVHVHVEALDDTSKPAYQEIIANYDEVTAVGDVFGTKKLLPLPSNAAIVFNVYVVKVVTFDGNTHVFSREDYAAKPDTVDAVEDQRTEKAERKKQQQQAQMLCWGAWWYRPLLVVNAAVLLLYTIWGLLAHLIRPWMWDRVQNLWDDWFVISRSTSWGTSSFLIPDAFIPELRSGWWFRAAVSDLLAILPIILLLLPFWCIWFSAWNSIGTSKLLKRVAAMAILMPLGYLLYDMFIALWLWISLENAGRNVIADSWGFMEWMNPWRSALDPLRWIRFHLIFAIPFISIFINARRHDKSLKLTRALMFWLPPPKA